MAERWRKLLEKKLEKNPDLYRNVSKQIAEYQGKDTYILILPKNLL